MALALQASALPAHVDRLFEAISTGQLGPHGLVGSRGYSVPDIENVEIVPFSDIKAGRIDNIRLASDEPGLDNYVVLEANCSLKRELRLHTSPRTTRATVFVGADMSLQGDLRLMGVDQTVILAGGLAEVGHSGQISAQIWGARALLFVGAKSTTNGSVCVLSGDDCAILVGDDCMFANGIHISTHDEHAVLDMETNQRVNLPGNVILEPHVWLGRNTTVGKNVIIGLGSVVGAHSLVTKSCPRFSVFAGSPAKVIRTGSTWDRYAAGRPDTVAKVKALASQVPLPVETAF